MQRLSIFQNGKQVTPFIYRFTNIHFPFAFPYLSLSFFFILPFFNFCFAFRKYCRTNALQIFTNTSTQTQHNIVLYKWEWIHVFSACWHFVCVFIVSQNSDTRSSLQTKLSRNGLMMVNSNTKRTNKTCPQMKNNESPLKKKLNAYFKYSIMLYTVNIIWLKKQRLYVVFDFFTIL